jgi:hypothetical protein
VRQLVGGVSTILPMNVPEYTFFFVAVLCGTVLFAAVQGVICGVVTNGNPDETRWQQCNDALNFMMEDTRVPEESRLLVRAWTLSTGPSPTSLNTRHPPPSHTTVCTSPCAAHV